MTSPSATLDVPMRQDDADDLDPAIAFRNAFPDLYGRARAVARRVLRDPDLAEEVAQETLTRTFERWAQVTQHPAPVAWVLDVAWKVSMETAHRRDRLRAILDPQEADLLA